MSSRLEAHLNVLIVLSELAIIISTIVTLSTIAL